MAICPQNDVYWGQMSLARGPALNLTSQIVQRAAAQPAQVWTPVDFLDLGPRAAVGKGLQRLVRAQAIARLDRGMSALTRKRGNLDWAHSAFFGRRAFCARSASRSR